MNEEMKLKILDALEKQNNALDNKEIIIRNENLRKAMDGDSVVVDLINNDEGRVVKIQASDRHYEVGEIIFENGIKYVKLDNPNKNYLINFADQSNLLVGHKVLVKIFSKKNKKTFNGEILKIIGHKNDPGIDILSKAYMYGVKTDFSNEVINEVLNFAKQVTNEDLIGRKDLRNKMIFTIDGYDAKDHDDAISLEILDNGNYVLEVHIADVSYYVREGSALDKEAYERSTSNYLVDKVIPMLPYELSNGICSLIEGVDRLTKTCEMEFDRKSGSLVRFDIYNSVINSKLKMTYDRVNLCLNGINEDLLYEPFIPTLLNMQELAKILRKNRKNRGSLDFPNTEMKIITDESGKTIDVLKKERIEAEKLIEEFMIAANTAVADYLSFLGIDIIYRIHGQPTQAKIEEFTKFVHYMDKKIIEIPKNKQSKAIKEILDQLKSSPDYEIYSYLLLRCMQRATYSVDNIGHYGLSVANYTRFTAPIREYIGIIVHRAIDKAKNTIKEYNNVEIKEYLNKAAQYATLKQTRANDLEREVLKMKVAEYMAGHIGEYFTGKITSISERGMHVDIYNGIEGFIKISDLNEAYFHYDSHSIYDGNKTYRLGGMVGVLVDSVEIFEGLIKLTISGINKSLKKEVENNAYIL